MFSQSDVADFWIGVTDLLQPGRWANIDGSSRTYSNWEKGQPSNMTDFDCGAMIISDGKWTTFNCYTSLKPFVCSVEAQITESPTVETQPKSCQPSWAFSNFTEYCYKIYQNETWTNAKVFCDVQGADLASIHSKDEALFVLGRFIKSTNLFKYGVIDYFL